MLLRRITHHIKNQNWFAVFLDFIIVVAGVFIGIQVSNWNESRVEAIREQKVLVAILDDLKTDLDVLDASLAMAEISTNASNYILEKAGFEKLDKISLPVVNFQIEGADLMINSGIDIPEERKDQLWKMVTVRYYPDQSNTAFSSLVAAGDLKIISDQSLISDLQSYSHLWNSIEKSNQSTHRSFRDQTVFVGQEFGLSPFTRVPEEQFIEMVQTVPKIQAVIRTMLEFAVLHQSQMKQARKKALSLIERVGQEIK